MTSRLLVDKLEGKTTSGTIQMPSGHVVQVITATSGDGSAITATTTTWVSGGAESEVSITPKFNNSKILVMCDFNADHKATDNRAMYSFFKSVNGGSYTNVQSANAGGRDSLVRIHDIGERILINQTMIFHETINSTDNLKYRAYVRSEVASESIGIRNDLTPLQIIAMEIAQ